MLALQVQLLQIYSNAKLADQLPDMDWLFIGLNLVQVKSI